jgi:thioredoxin reductase
MYVSSSYSPQNHNIVTTQGCSTIDRHIFATGTDETKPEVHIWEKKVRYCKYICNAKYDFKYADQDIP